MPLQIQPIPVALRYSDEEEPKNDYETMVMVNLMELIDTSIVIYKDTPPAKRSKTMAKEISLMIATYNRRAKFKAFKTTWWI